MAVQTAYAADGTALTAIRIPITLLAGSAGGQQPFGVGIDERPPHEQGAGALRFVPVGAVKRVDGGRPTSRGLPPAALGDGGRGEMAAVPQKGFSRVWIP